ncbi:xanthine dehydrogenase small subunit [Reinekea thalattae]|uniref:Xanthine dehydrogenase small subunit n=1 Tax=Reinekea thalattae TaxID=2593301 RepID=A0A5C8Z2X6_9GAMM|nr:xanthine dehydrogenase small subunit [Reinekea thalattae]TXR51907.1 xanthine dehydrogenase small subunit [Reinekea thalattae]
MIRFLLNNRVVELDGVAPTLSTLDWLRTKTDLAGTKEGCASGDCGACTVVIGEQQDGELSYKSMNACLLLVGQLNGKHLVTVEGLTVQNTTDALSLEALHPVQRAMVECHGSQCGFCTPGFIMSMFTLYMNHVEYPGEHQVIEQLGGNLCRCTGYRPILAACEQMYQYPRAENHLSAAASDFFALPALPEASLSHQQQQFYLPADLATLTALRSAHPAALLVTGGTDLSLAFTQQLQTADAVISLADVAELKQIDDDRQGLTIGAALSYSQFMPSLLNYFPEATELFSRLGSMQVRNAGSLGGSLGNASPIGDPAPLLLALDAEIQLVSQRGERWLAIADFFLDYRKTQLAEDEVIARIFIPARKPNSKLACYKISKRMEDDISAVCCVIHYQLIDGVMQNVKTGFGGMAAIPKAANQLQDYLEGKALTAAEIEHAAERLTEDFQPMADVRASKDYRMQVSKNLLQRLWLEQSSQLITRVDHAAL